MTHETSKAVQRLVNDPLFRLVRSYAGASAIDLGCGPDCLPGAEGYDQAQGDVESLVPPPKHPGYRLVWSSHCLEHLDHPLTALARWWQLVEPGGYLWLLVPDFYLHEHGVWPSRNRKHKWAFSLWREPLVSDTECRDGLKLKGIPHFNLITLVRSLPDSELLRLQIADTDYDYSRMYDTGLDQSAGTAEVACEMVVRKAPA